MQSCQTHVEELDPDAGHSSTLRAAANAPTFLRIIAGSVECLVHPTNVGWLGFKAEPVPDGLVPYLLVGACGATPTGCIARTNSPAPAPFEKTLSAVVNDTSTRCTRSLDSMYSAPAMGVGTEGPTVMIHLQFLNNQCRDQRLFDFDECRSKCWFIGPSGETPCEAAQQRITGKL